jgi:predicted amidohydrolase YtcJ
MEVTSMRETFLGLSLALLALGFAGCSSTSATVSAGTPVASAGAHAASCTKAAKIFYGDKGRAVITMNPDKMTAEAVAVCKDGTIADVGDKARLLEVWEDQKNRSTELVQLRLPRTLLPGFVEPHTHLALTVQSQLSVQCGSQEPNFPVATVLKKLQDAAALAKDGQWVVGNQFDPSRSDPLFGSLNAEILDRDVSKKIPVFVLNASGHIAYVNTPALLAANVKADTYNKPLGGGGEIVRDPVTNMPTGQLNEEPAIKLVSDKIPVPVHWKELLHETAACVLQQWAAAGVTTSAEISLGVGIPVKDDWELYQALAAKHGPIRFRVYVDHNQVKPNTDGNLSTPKDKSPFLVFKHNEGNDWLKVLGVKFVTDGSTQGFTAALTQPYLYPPQMALQPPNEGTLNFRDNKALAAEMGEFYKYGWQLVAHANGDRAIDQVLTAYETLADPSERRLRIEHFTVTNPSQNPGQLEDVLNRVQALGVTPGMTAGHLYFWGDVFYQSILGRERTEQIHPSKSLKDKGIRFAYNSDSPITKVEPLRYVQTEVTRAPQPSIPNSPKTLGDKESIEVLEALSAVTLDAAYQVFFDDKVGSLEVGKLADFVVLDRNPLLTSPSNIADIQVLETYLGGERVYDRSNPGPCPLPPE